MPRALTTVFLGVSRAATVSVCDTLDTPSAAMNRIGVIANSSIAHAVKTRSPG